MRRAAAIAFLLALAVCGEEPRTRSEAECAGDLDCAAGLECRSGMCVPRGTDGGGASAGPTDAGAPRDGGVGDAGPDGGEAPQDAGQRDAGPEDSGAEDAGLVDAGAEDSGPRDAGLDDASADAGGHDAGPGDAGPQATVAWCELHWPAWTWSSSPEAGARIEGWAWEPGRTPGPGAGGGLRGEAGYGAPGTDPRGDAWTWTQAAYHADVDGTAPGDRANDAFRATIHPPRGEWAVAFRFSLDDGPWRFCDLAGPMNGREALDKLGHLDADPSGARRPDWCNVQHPPSASAAAGAGAGDAYGQVLVVGVTEPAGQGAGVEAELGVGPRGSSPANGAAGWSWSQAVYNAGCAACGNNDEYWAPLFAPAVPGEYDFAFRFRVNGGPWHYADRKTASSDGCADGYDHRAAGKLTAE